eukprot:TRINITY_DN309_c1_g2_i2.p1 TRINITY_DN309_c1_g2~~TRINITY_DN309_c1_g2_i2.p1  ORF type:complete len:229 (+),score=44.56 TRINITY_DN309_c1_g2_i2:104-688(+)
MMHSKDKSIQEIAKKLSFTEDEVNKVLRQTNKVSRSTKKLEKEVKQWLKDNDLETYAKEFEKNGYHTMQKIIDAEKEKLIKDFGCKQGSAFKLEEALKTATYRLKTLVSDKFIVKNFQHNKNLSEEEKKFDYTKHFENNGKCSVRETVKSIKDKVAPMEVYESMPSTFYVHSTKQKRYFKIVVKKQVKKQIKKR